MINVGKESYKSIKDVPGSVPSATIRGSVFLNENIGNFGIADLDAKGERGGTMYYVVAEVPERLRPNGIEINFLTKLYFRITDKREDVHPAVLAQYDGARSNLVSF